MPTPPLKTLDCRICGRSFQYESVQTHKPFPFCSERCQQVDLGHWFNGDYRIPGPEPVHDEHELPYPDEADE